MTIPCTFENGIFILSPIGELTSKTIHQLSESLMALLENPNGRAVCLNFKDVTLIDSVGLGVIAALAKQLKEQNTKFFLCNLSKIFREIFHITALDRKIDIFKTQREALGLPK